MLATGFFLAAGAVSAALLTGRPVVASDPRLAPAAAPVPADVVASEAAGGVAGGPVPAAAQDR